MLTVNGAEELRPEKQYFDNFPQQPSTKVGLRSTPFEDLYVVLGDWTGDGATAQISLAVFINPLVSWIWAGGVLLLLGTVITMWPRRAVAPASRGAARSGSRVGTDAADGGLRHSVSRRWHRKAQSSSCCDALSVAALLVLMAACPRWPTRTRSTTASAAWPCSCSAPSAKGETVADSPSGLAADMRSVIRTKLAAGESDQQILDEFVASYGDSILTEPPKRGISLGVWLGPSRPRRLMVGVRCSSRGGVPRRRAEHQAPALAVDSDVAEEFHRFREEFGR